eukprot:gene26717-19513_t
MWRAVTSGEERLPKTANFGDNMDCSFASEGEGLVFNYDSETSPEAMNMSVHEHQHNFTPPTYTGEANMLNVGLGANKPTEEPGVDGITIA